MSEVVSLARSQDRENSHSVALLLKQLLESAEKGEITGIAVAAMHSGSGMGRALIGNAYQYEMIGMIEEVKHMILQRLEG